MTRLRTIAGRARRIAERSRIGRRGLRLLGPPEKEPTSYPLFDPDWYLRTYPEVAQAGLDPLTHFMQVGAREGRNPSPLFDTRWYLDRHPDVARAGVNPLVHYVENGARDRRDPCALFDAKWYLEEYPEVARSGVNPLLHYIAEGARQGLDPCPLFDTRWYLAEHPDVAAAGINPLAHYAETGAAAGLDPSPLFDTDWYAAQYPDVARSGMNPLAHYLRVGLGRGYAPNRYNEVVLVDEFLARGNVTTAARLFAVMDPVPLPNAPAHVVLCDLADLRGAAAAGGRMLATPEQLAPHLGGPPRSEPAPYLAEIDDVLVLPGSATLIDEGGRALSDALGLGREEDARIPGMPDILRVPGRRVLIRFSEKAFPVVERGLHLCQERDHDDLHWLAEVLPRLFLAEQVLSEKDVPVLVSGPVETGRRELLDLVRHPERPVLALESSRLHQVRRLVYPSEVGRVGDAGSIAVGLLRAMAAAVKERAGAPAAGRARRLYLRSRSQKGSVVGERAVEEMLVGRGFELLDARDLSARARIGLFAEAEAVVGAAGPALADILWCAPSARVLALHADAPAAGLAVWESLARASSAAFASLAGRRAYKRTGRDAADDNFEIDASALADRVDALLRGR